MLSKPYRLFQGPERGHRRCTALIQPSVNPSSMPRLERDVWNILAALEACYVRDCDEIETARQSAAPSPSPQRAGSLPPLHSARLA